MAIKLAPSQAVDKRYLRLPVASFDSGRFVHALHKFFLDFNEQEKEEYNKTLVRDFLKEAFYDGTNAINIYENADSAIYADVHSQNSYPVVLCEAKRPGSNEMIDAEHLNRKALHELILYYLREEVRNRNRSIKHLVVTDGLNWFVFKKKVFLDLFARDKEFVKDVFEMDDSKEYRSKDIYSDVIKPVVERKKEKLVFTYFSLAPYKKIGKDYEMEKDARLRAIYKLLSPHHLLLQQSYVDYNKLNDGFYNELLYIIGLEDVADSNSQARKIKRLPKNKRQYYSLLEQSILKLRDYGLDDESELFDVALSLVLEWLNRVLFLKLLEGLLINIQKEKSPQRLLLTIERIPDYGSFYDLCMTILAKPYGERDEEMLRRFKDVPYLNSSLFELSEQEKQYFSINAISKGKMEIYSKTVVKENGLKTTGRMDSLEYLFRFLGSYDFSSDGSKSVGDANTIINSSVLGLIFEKINGYKDGAFFTPGYIAEYMCRDIVRQAIVSRFNSVKGWTCGTFADLLELVDFHKPSDRQEANDVINGIKICDPAVGSGHFLVAALNEIIYAKSQLRILQYFDTKERLRDYEVNIENGEIVLTSYDGEQFCYHPNDDSKRVQQTMFEEKRHIIENCLYGVDLNRKSVDICRLRLWIELLKSIYYHKDLNGEPRLQTLPNIDINIKCGNSLLSKFPVAVGGKFSSITISEEKLQEYKCAVSQYKNCTDKSRKVELRQTIENFKFGLLLEGSQTTFYDSKSKKDLLAQSIYRDSLEWMIEFPEVLGEKMQFEGFDVIIGNPPYVSLEKQKELSKYLVKHLVYSTYDGKGDLYTLFVERAFSLLKPNGLLSLIIPNKWMKVGYGSKMRSFLAKKKIKQLVDFRDNQVFEEATTYTCIIQAANDTNEDKFLCASLPVLDKDALPESISENSELASSSDFGSGIWITSSAMKRALLRKLGEECVQLADYVGSPAKYGIKTGKTEVFVVPEAISQQLLNHSSAKGIVVPFLQGSGMKAFASPQPENSLLFIPKGFTRRGMGKDCEEEKPSEDDAWQWFRENYPSLADYLAPFANACKGRSDMGDYWWELRACTYYEQFSSPKIFYQRMPVKPCFVYEERTILCNDSVWFIPDQGKKLMALLNSDVAWWLMKEYCPPIQNGCQLNWENFKQIPVPRQLPEALSVIADDILAARNEGDLERYNSLISKLNLYVRELYGIDDEMVL